MDFPQYTSSQRRDIKAKALADQDYKNIWDILKNMLGQNGIEVEKTDDFEKLMYSGDFRDGDGKRFPEGWTYEDFVLYLKDKENSLSKVKGSEYARWQEEKNRMFSLYVKDQNVYKGVSVDVFEDREAPAAADSQKISVTEHTLMSGDITIRDHIEEDTEINNAVRDAVSDLLKDLTKTDSIFSNDSDQYKKFKKSLVKLSKALDSHEPQNADDVLKAFFVRDRDGNTVMDCAEEYISAKSEKPGELNSRRLDRISICRRLLSIKDIFTNAKEELLLGKRTGCRKEMLRDAVAQKALLGKLKSIGNADAKKTFTDRKLYQDRLSVVKEGLQSGNIRELKKLAAKSSDSVAEALSPGTVKNNKTKDSEKAARLKQAKDAIASMDKDNVKWTLAAEYLLARSVNMLSELKANDSSSHSKEYSEFRDSIQNLHESVVGIALDKNFSREKLAEVLSESSAAAEFYQIRHMNDKAADADPKVIQRLGLAAEIRICREFLSNPENKEPDVLFEKLLVHQNMMRDLNTARKQLAAVNREELSDFLFDLDRSSGKEREDHRKHDLKIKKADYTKRFNSLIKADSYGKTVDKIVMDEYGTEKPDKEELNIIMTGVVDNKPTDKLFIKERKAEIDLENSREFDDMFETLSNVKLVESKKAPQLH